MQDYLLISGLQHFSFCRRQWALIHIEQQWAENLLTIQGLLMHEKAHGEMTEKRGDQLITRGLHVCSHQLKITGICDIVNFDKDQNGISLYGHKGKYRVTPVEYKRGRPKSHMADALQLCAQAICLEEMLCCEIPYGYLFYGQTRRRTPIEFSAELRKCVVDAIDEMRLLYQRGHTPKVKTSSKCGACSLKEICLPVLTKRKSASRYIKDVFAASQSEE